MVPPALTERGGHRSARVHRPRKGIYMTIRFNLVLGIAAIIFALALVAGTAGHQAMNASTHSPYVSALSNAAVATAEASNSHRCQNRSCGNLQGIVTCT